MANDEAKMTRLIQREIGRRQFDSSRLDIKFSHGIVFLRGQIKRLRGHENLDLKEELTIIYRILRQKDGIREVHYEDVLIR